MMARSNFIIRLLKSAGEAIFPACCEVCGTALVDGEDMLCLKCLYNLPRTHFNRSDWNLMHEKLADTNLRIDRAAAFFSYVKGEPYALLLQKAKYNRRPDIARKLGAMYARELQTEGFFEDIDMLLPVPLHWLKQLRRGYNQSEQICQGISEVTGIPVGDNLRAGRHSTQTRKNATERRSNTEGIFSVTCASELDGRHILIVDDIITTGATLYSAAEALRNVAPTARLSVLTLGSTR